MINKDAMKKLQLPHEDLKPCFTVGECGDTNSSTCLVHQMNLARRVGLTELYGNQSVANQLL